MKSKMKSFLVILLLLLLCGTSVGLLREYKLVTKAVNWSEAQSYCRQKFTDLATITTDTEQNKLVWSEEGFYLYAWIGLKRTEPLSNTWQWSDGQTPTLFKWKNSNLTKSKTTEDCVISTPLGWDINSCSKRCYFFCYRSLTLVMENKTWDEALEYCRSYHTALASLTVPAQLRLAEQEVAPAQTTSVWTGLRFIARKWMWVTGEEASITFSQNSCPAPRYRCGAHNFNTHVWENRDCKEKLQFLCY